MIELDSREKSPEINTVTAKQVADNVISQWEYGMESERNHPTRTSLGRMVLDCLDAERPLRNELQMLELIRALTSRMNKITLHGDDVNREVKEAKEAIKHLDEAYDEYKDIENI